MKDEFKKLDKIYKCIKSCNTVAQFDNAFLMLVRYSIKRPNNVGVILFMTQIQDYALIKGELLTQT